MTRALGAAGPRYLWPVVDSDQHRPARLRLEVGDPVAMLIAALRAEVEAAADKGVITRGESDELLARLTIVVDQAVGGR